MVNIQKSIADTIMKDMKEATLKKEKSKPTSGTASRDGRDKKKAENLDLPTKSERPPTQSVTSIDGFTEGFDDEFGSPCPQPPSFDGADKSGKTKFNTQNVQAEEPEKGSQDPKMPKDLWNTESSTAQYVEATLKAWNQCPSIVKKQLDEQHKKIKELDEKLRSANLRVNQKKDEFNRHAQVEMKLELQKHKDKVEQGFRKKLEEDKLKMNKQKVKEMDQLMQENFALKKQVMDMENKNNRGKSKLGGGR